MDPGLALADARNSLGGAVPAAIVDHDDFPCRRRGGGDLARFLDGTLDVQLLVVGGQHDGKGGLRHPGPGSGDDRLVVQRMGEMDERAVGGERPVAECLGKIVGGIVVVDAQNALVFPAEKVLRVGQLHAESRCTLDQP